MDPTMLRAINEILQVQSRPTRDTEEKAKTIIEYATMYPNAIFRYKDSDMVLHVYSYAAYLTMPEAIICYAGHCYLTDWPSPSPKKPNPERKGPIHTECKTTRNVVSSAAETETCGTFKNVRTAISMQPDLITLEHST